jgi:hypothetical protein
MARGVRWNARVPEEAFLQQYLAGKPGVRYDPGAAWVAAFGAESSAHPRRSGLQMLNRQSTRKRLTKWSDTGQGRAERMLLRTEALASATAKDVMTWDASGSLTVIPSDQMTEGGLALVRVRKTTRTLPDGSEITESVVEMDPSAGTHARRDLLKIDGVLVDRKELTGKDGAPLFDPGWFEREIMGVVEGPVIRAALPPGPASA